MVYNIPIHGLIGSPESKEDTQSYFQYTDLLLHINKAKAFDTLNLDIASDGGYVDICDRMIDAIKATGKIITSCNSGNVASAASKLFTLAPKGQRTFYPSRGMFLIHNPWGEIEGDATQLAEASKQLKATENEYAKWYAIATGSDIEVIKAFMAENVPLTPEQVESLGFATIGQATVKAVAKLTFNNNLNMDQKEVVEKLNGFEKLLQKMAKFLKIKAIMLADANGKELEFPDLTDVSEIVVGVKVNSEGAPANGEYTQKDGSIFVCKEGVLTEIKPAQTNEMETVKKENADLKAEIEGLKAQLGEKDKATEEALKIAAQFKTEFTEFKTKFSDFKIKAAKPSGETDDKPVIRKPFKTKE